MKLLWLRRAPRPTTPLAMLRALVAQPVIIRGEMRHPQLRITAPPKPKGAS